ncbi:LysR family transcriptional regulator [Novosphingobium sp. PS1R-30]|uniref:LysR family transcriptional regulator n=1 Tax=Novosphingobium anseongense TaxID=3133436 RepID=A0ABU8S0N8_9SPHN
MGLKTLRTLIAIADHGGFSAAAEALFVTQSAVSMQMKALEEEWRMPLFDRGRRPPVLNQAGWKLVQHGRKLIDQYDALKRSDALLRPDVAGLLRVGVVPSVATGILPGMLAWLGGAYPDCRVHVRSGLSQDLIRELGAGTIEAAVVTEPDRVASGLVARSIRTDELKMYVHRELAEGDVARTLAAVPFARFTKEIGIGRTIDRALKDREIEVNPYVELDSVDAMLRIVRMRLAATIIPEASVPEDCGDTVLAMSLSPPVFRKLSLVLKQEYAEAPMIEALLEALAATARA